MSNMGVSYKTQEMLTLCVHPLVWGGSVLLIFLLFFVELCFLFVLVVFVLCLVCLRLPVSLDSSFLIATSVFSNITFIMEKFQCSLVIVMMRDCMIVSSLPIPIQSWPVTTTVVYWIQFYMSVKFVSDLQQVCVFFQVLQVSSTKKLDSKFS